MILRFLVACMLFMGWLGIPRVSAHEVEGGNLQLIAELTEEKLSFDVTVETSLLPPLEGVRFGSEPFPTSAEVEAAVLDYFAEHCPVLIDGIVVRPLLEAIEFAAMENQVNLGEVADFVVAYLILEYPVKTKPQTVDMTWGIYLPDKVKELVPQEPDPTGHDPQTVGSIFYTFGELDLMKFTPGEPQYVWHTPQPILSVDAQRRLQAAEAAVASPGGRRVSLAWPLAGGLLLAGIGFGWKRRLPWAVGFGLAAVASLGATKSLEVSLGGGSKSLTAAQAEQRFRDVHQNIYRAFDYQDDDAIYDTLSQSVSGELLDKVYQDVYKSLVLRDEGGAVCRVRKLEYLKCDPVVLKPEEKGYAFDCHWRVDGLVQHHSHTHERLNDYEARYLLSEIQGLWKISGVEILRENRLNPTTMEREN